MLAASPMRAAEAVDLSLPAPTAAKATVIRADPHTGRLVRRWVPSVSRAASKAAPAEIGILVDRAAKAHNVDPLLVHSIIKVESNYNSQAVSPKGAEGLMQLTPSTARMLGVSDSFDPGQNIEAGVKYFKLLKDLYKDDRLALAAYNAGPGAVEKYKWIPPYPETQNYVYQVGKRYVEARRAAEVKSLAPTVPAEQQVAEPATTQEEQHPRLEQFIDEHGRLHLSTVQ